MTKPTIIAVVGASGSGKTHLSKVLQAQCNVFLIVSYTTRAKREGEIEGVDHFYIKDSRHIDRREKLSYTQFAGREYFALESQVPPHQPCVYVVDERGLRFLKEKKSKRFNIFSVLVKCEQHKLVERGIDAERILRDKDREPLPAEYYDYIIDNNGTQEEFDQKIYETYEKIKQCQHPRK